MRTEKGKQTKAPEAVQKFIELKKPGPATSKLILLYSPNDVKNELWEMLKDSFAADTVDQMSPIDRQNRLYLYENLCGLVNETFKTYKKIKHG